jgi:acetyl esterase/lipase
MSKRPFLVLLVVLFTTACTRVNLAVVNGPAYLQNHYTLQTVAYGPDPVQDLDIYRPENSVESADVIVFFHGGRWTTGRREDYRFLGATLARQGFVVVIPNYRKYPAVRFPVFVEDGAKALAWVHDHIAAHGGNPQRIHLSGHSAGAHIGALLTLNPAYLAAEGKAVPDVIRDFAGLAGPYAFTPREADLRELFGGPDGYPQMQATTFVDGTAPPLLLQYGEADTDVGACNHLRLAQAILAHGGKVKILTYPGVDHIDIISAFTWINRSSPVMADMVRFFRRQDDRGMDQDPVFDPAVMAQCY